MKRIKDWFVQTVEVPCWLLVFISFVVLVNIVYNIIRIVGKLT